MLFLLQTFSCLVSLSKVSDTQESAIGLLKYFVFQELLFKFHWDGFKETTNQHIIFSSFVYFRKIWLLAKTTHMVRLNAKAAKTTITLRTHGNSWSSCSREEGECLNSEFSTLLPLPEGIRRQTWNMGHLERVMPCCPHFLWMFSTVQSVSMTEYLSGPEWRKMVFLRKIVTIS